MKKQTALAGACLPLILLLLFGCTKHDVLAPDQRMSMHVRCTLPANAAAGAGLYDSLSVTLDCTVDTLKYDVTVLLQQAETRVPGTVVVTDSVIHFFPAEELQPFQLYVARLTLTPKIAGFVPLKHEWSFTTKGPDEYAMTLRSQHVTDGNRDGTRCMQIGNYFYSFGGWKDPPLDSYNDVYRSSGNLSKWERMPDAPWHGRHVFGTGRIQDSTYVIGGDPFHSDFDVWRTTDGEQWTRLAANLLGNRVLYGCTAHKGFLYVVGGTGYADVWRSPNGSDWEKVADDLPFLRKENIAGSLVSFNGKLWVVCGGGDGWGGGTPRNDVWSSADGREWQREEDFPGTARYYTDVCVWDNKLWVVGGYNYAEGNVKSIWYRKPGGEWTEFETPNEYIGRHATGVGVYNNSLVITCGNYNNDCWVIEKRH